MTDLVLPGTSCLLLGAPGAGKTWSLTTYIKAGLELFVVVTDPGGEETLLDAMAAQKLPMEKLHWKYIPPAAPSFDILKDMAKKINTMAYEDLTKLKAGIGTKGYTQFYDLLSCLSNFEDQNGESFGSVDEWGPDRALAIDSLSGINVMCMDMMIGAKPAAHQGEWGVAMNAEEKLLVKLCSDLRCFFTLTAHLEREVDEVVGGVKLMAGALGRKLAPKLPRNFSDVVSAYREGGEFYWSTIQHNVDLKTRSLPLRDKIAPDEGQFVQAQKKRSELAAQSTQKEANS